ncbi:helix-turn-helix transcriptional regulator [Clostridium oceanicum]|uniref:Helix-turn-helix domain-containing protein n=1 Tax=Clostridium oceanicum TaxID=1543 RepID=A0ABN1JFG6_9CLOT
MNEVSIGTTILRLRKEKGITQEKLSSMIGVSKGAVSKWETLNSKPDIDLLAPIARALDTSLNELLSFKEELTEEEISEIKKELTEKFLYFGFVDGEEKSKEYLKKYPNSMGLKLAVGGLIIMYSSLLGDDSDPLAREKKEYALSLLYKVEDSKNLKYVNNSLFQIAMIQMELENYDESEKCIKKLKDSFVDPMTLYASLLERQGKNEEAEKFCESMLLMYLSQSTAMMSILSRINMINNDFDKSVLYLNAVNEIENSFKIGQCSGKYNLCRRYLKKGEKSIAAEYFNKYVDGLISSEYNYDNNPYFKNIELEVKEDCQKIIRKNLFQTLIEDDDLKELKENPEYIEAIEKLKSNILQI